MQQQNHKNYNIGNQHVIVRAESVHTAGICAVLEMHHSANSGPPLHMHAHEDEGFFILAGTYRFQVGNEEKTIMPGDFIMAARGVAHSFRNLGPDLGKMLIYLTPAGLEAYFEEMSLIQMEDPNRAQKCAALDSKYGISILGRGVK